jgi:hypothetical protein
MATSCAYARSARFRARWIRWNVVARTPFVTSVRSRASMSCIVLNVLEYHISSAINPLMPTMPGLSFVAAAPVSARPNS